MENVTDNDIREMKLAANDPVTEDRTVVESNGSLYANIPKAARLLGWQAGDDIDVTITKDGIIVEQRSESNE